MRLRRWAREPPQTQRAGGKKNGGKKAGGKGGGGKHPSTRPRYARHVGVRRLDDYNFDERGGGKFAGMPNNRGGDISQLPVVTPGFMVPREQEVSARQK